MADSYYRQVFSQSCHETKLVWTVHRWWFAVGGPICALLFLSVRKGWHSLMNLGDIAINAAGGAVIVFVGTFIINLFRSPKILDAKLLAEIDGLRKENEAHRATIAAHSVPKFPPKLEEKIRKFVSDHPQSTALFNYLMVNDEWDERQLTFEQDGPELIKSGILKRRVVRTSGPSDLYPDACILWSIASQYQPIISYILYEENQDTRT